MIKFEQALIYAGVLSLCWMIMVLSHSGQLKPELVDSSIGSGLTLLFFLAGIVGVVLLIVNLLRGYRTQLRLRMVGLSLFILVLFAFATVYI